MGVRAYRRMGEGVSRVAAWRSAEGVVQDSLGRSPRNYNKIGDQR